MAPFDKLKTPKVKFNPEKLSVLPDGNWVQCKQCKKVAQYDTFEKNLKICLKCNYYGRLTARERIDLLSDSFEPYQEDWVSIDPLHFKDSKTYQARLKDSKSKLNLTDAFIAGRAELQGVKFHLGVFEFGFMGGSMGCVVGQHISQVFYRAMVDRLPAVIVSCSGGARMQEGVLSLMQMAKTVSQLSLLKQSGIPYISILTDPTTGGVAASFAMLGDVILAEPKALIAFTGPRVIEQTMRQKLPEGFQTSEFLLKKGFIDRVVDRHLLASELRYWMLQLGKQPCSFGKLF
jgi:acetyl-CoA carboxylase carboxyl transferase subunit beta